jgi:hypothetical protein
MTDYRIEAATKEEWAERALRAEANAFRASNAAFLEKRRADEAEAKLAKAVWRLEQMRDDRTGYRHPSHYIRGAAVTLSELQRDAKS